MPGVWELSVQGSLGLLSQEGEAVSQHCGGMRGESPAPEAPAAVLILTSASPAFSHSSS